MQLLNLGGFGLAAWDPRSPSPSRPFTYWTPASDVRPQPQGAVREGPGQRARRARARRHLHPAERVGLQNVHPFLFDGAAFAMAQNGDLYDFERMRYDLLEHIRRELMANVEGTTDTEWVYALTLAQLEDPMGTCSAQDMADATREALRDHPRRA